MSTYIVLLRAVNVGGTGKVKMAPLRQMCVDLGFANVETVIASGNIVLDSQLKPAAIKKLLQESLLASFGLETTVYVYSVASWRKIERLCPFQSAKPNQAVVVFLGKSLNECWREEIKNRNGEEIEAGLQVLYIHYPNGMSGSKLKIPVMNTGTTRNMNTVRKLLTIADSR